MLHNLDNSQTNVNFIATAIGLTVTSVGILWNIAETKRKLENQFQQSQKDIDIAKKDMKLSELELELKVQVFFQNTKEIINTLGSQVDLNSGAVEAFKALRSNSVVIQDLNKK